jgi:hypothetical protein
MLALVLISCLAIGCTKKALAVGAAGAVAVPVGFALMFVNATGGDTGNQPSTVHTLGGALGAGLFLGGVVTVPVSMIVGVIGFAHDVQEERQREDERAKRSAAPIDTPQREVASPPPSPPSPPPSPPDSAADAGAATPQDSGSDTPP